MGLCNFFRTHIKDFAIITALLFRLTQKDSGYKSGPLPDQELQAFYALQKQLTSKPVMAFPKADQQYASSQMQPQAPLTLWAHSGPYLHK
jgi:hypothetical protein